jgi:cbb3-type cytochrome oxidase subunit 3
VEDGVPVYWQLIAFLATLLIVFNTTNPAVLVFGTFVLISVGIAITLAVYRDDKK